MSPSPIVCLLLLVPSGIHAQVLPTDGQPRQPAQLVGDCGGVSFPIRCEVVKNQEFFNQGVAHLHAHAYLEAERDFRQVTTTEPDLGIAYWGMAMANFASPSRAADLVEQALLRRGKATARERQWIDALARYYEVTAESAQRSRAIKKAQGFYAKLPARTFRRPVRARAAELITGLRKLVADDPKDVEAVLFLVDQLGRDRELGIPTENAAKTQESLWPLFKSAPQHVTRYHLMRLWLPANPERAIGPLAILPRPAPAVPEQWHLEGRVYAAQHNHSHAVHYFATALRLWHRRMARYRMMPYRTPGYAALVRDLGASLINIGLGDRVMDLANRLIEFPRHPLYNQQGNPEHLAGLAPLLVIRYGGLYDAPKLLIEWEDSGKFATGRSRQGAVRVAAELGIAYARTGKRARADRWRKRLRALRADAWSAADARRIDNWITQLDVWSAVLHGRNDDALRGLQTCEMPALDRALCYQLLEEDKRAIEWIEASLQGARWPVAAKVRQVSMLYEQGEKKRARVALDRWWTETGCDRSAFMGRIAHIVKEFGHDPSSWWRKPDPTTPEMRKHFANQGPQTWQPFAARNWELLGLNGKPLSLARYKGKPFIVILYLGFGCIHCVEQLRDFHPHVKAYRKAGLEILAIGTDRVENMRAAMKDLPADERFAYTMLSDPKMRVFRDWVAYDSFGKMPMHGTYLVSGDGKILFQDISHEPFDHPEWFLKECKRLLAR